MKKAQFTISISGGVFNDEGDILLLKNENGDWELPRGTVGLRQAEITPDERIIRETLIPAIEAKTGISFDAISKKIQSMPAMYPTFTKGYKDMAFAIIVGKIDEAPTKKEARFIDIHEFFSLVKANLVSGREKRMCLRMFASRDCPNEWYRKLASAMLETEHL